MFYIQRKKKLKKIKQRIKKMMQKNIPQKLHKL